MVRYRFVALIAMCLAQGLAAQAKDAPIQLSVDAAEVARRILHVTMTFAVAPGATTFVYPKWIPGEHGPSGPLGDVSGLKFAAGNSVVPWQRDPVDMYAFHVQVPTGTSALEVHFDVLGTTSESNFLLGNSATLQQAVVNWNQVVLYPANVPSDNVTVEAQLTLPAGWKFGTALPVRTQTGQNVAFAPASLTMLVDSPVLAGARFREYDVTPNGEARKHFLDIAADSDAALDIPADVIGAYRKLVAETGALFQARHYDSYHFLVSLHGTFEDGLEHHQSSDNRLPEMGLADPQWRTIYAYLLAHEMVHSWNGKYRRPAGLATPDYQQPMKDDLLWVYEGLTNHLGQVLAARSGLWTPEQYRNKVADFGAMLDNRPGRTWRSLQDTAISAPVGYGGADEWAAARRGADFPDFYNEGSLIWLEADTIIRTQSKGTRSLDDFCRAFHGGKSGPPEVVPYTYDDLVAALNQIVAYDWRAFFQARLTSLSEHAPLGGVQAAGWRLVYSDEQSALSKAYESQMGRLDLRYSIGALMDAEGDVTDVIPGTPAAAAGLVPGMKVLGVNMRRFSPQRLRDAIREGNTASANLQLLVSSQEDFLSLNVHYHGGERYPHLERNESKPDLLGIILSPLSPVQ